MWWAALILNHLWALNNSAWARDNVAAVTPQNCSLDCIQQGRPECEYCRITTADIKDALGFNSFTKFGSCVPWPCFHFLGTEDPQLCQHYVHAPNDVKIEVLDDPNPIFDTIVVSWRPSYYGIAFLRGFQVSLQHLGGSRISCQLFLFHRNLTLQPSHAHMVYKSDPFRNLTLGTQFAVTVIALPVPEQWERFYHSELFSTRSCTEKNGLDQCSKDWYPTYTEVTQEGTSITVTFNLAPARLGISSYFLQCYANGMKKYVEITPNFSENKTHHSFQLNDLIEGNNYTCEIAANKEDAVRKTFSVYIQHKAARTRSVAPSLTLMLLLCSLVLLCVLLLLAACFRKGPALTIRNLFMKPGLFRPSSSEMEQHVPEVDTPEEAVALPVSRVTPPRLLICYSSNDGPAHVNAVMRLGAFIQKHMATQVCLDLWDSLRVAQEGSVAWHCQHIRESDFILVICSEGLCREEAPDASNVEYEEADVRLDWASDAAVRLVGEEVCRAKARGQDLSKYIAAVFDHCDETHIPTELKLVSNYSLPNDLGLLFSHLHGVALYRPGAYLKVNHISLEAFTQLPAGAALQQAIYEADMARAAKRHWSPEQEI